MISIKRGAVFFENTRTFALQVVELAAAERPGEHAEDGQHQQHRHRDQQVENVHLFVCYFSYRDSRSEFSTTNSELLAMPSPAAHGGSQPTRASGTQAAL